jgi:hypothetical protein
MLGKRVSSIIKKKVREKARSWKPKRELKHNQQKKFGLNTES